MKAKDNQDFIVYLRRPDGTITTVKAKDGLTLGRDYGCDITVDDEALPDTYKLLSCKGQSYTLRLPSATVGTIRKGQEELSIASLIKLGLLKEESSGYYTLDLRSGVNVELRFGKDNTTSIMRFGYKERPKKLPIRIAIPFITSREYLFLAVFVVSILSHLLFAAYLETIEIKKVSSIEALKKLPPRFARLILSPQKKAKIEERSLSLKQEEEKKEEPKKKKVKKKDKKKTKEAKKEPAPKGVKGKGVLGVIAAKGGILSSATASEIWHDVDTLVAMAKTTTTAGGDNLQGLGTGNGGGLSEEDIKSGWAQESRSKEEILREKRKRTALKVSKKKARTAVSSNSLRHEAEVYRIVRSYSGGLKYLYNNELRRDPSLKGTITVTMTISADGRVKEAKVKDSTLSSPSLESAMLKRIYMWKFRVVEKAPDFTINYTFDFSPIG